MINITLLKREIKANYKLLLIFCAVLTLYSSMIISMFNPKLGESLNMMMQSMPDLFAAFGMSSPGSSLIEFMINYLYGFLFIVFPLVFIIILANRLIARYIDRGAMAYLLATPNRRFKIILTQCIGMMLSTFLLMTYVTILCIILSEVMFPGALEISKFILVNIGLYGLIIFLVGVCFCAACIFNDSKYSIGIGAGFCIAFVLIQMVSQVGEKFEGLKYITPLTLFAPSKIITGDINGVVMFGTLYIIGIVLLGSGIAIFCKRDIPV